VILAQLFQMKERGMRHIVRAFGLAVVMAGATSMLFAQGKRPADAGVHVPDSSIEQPGERGIAAHTNHLIRVQPGFVGTSPSGETPASIASVYNLAGQLAGSGVIVIVDAFHYPTALNDFNVFSQQFGLPRETSANALSSTNTAFQVVYARGNRPRTNCGWAQEAALDIEWAHAMAPSAKIVLVEARSNSFADLFQAVDVASSIAGAREVSMSWGGGEFSGEAANDGHFTTPGIVYFAASGDTGGTTIYPGVSPNVVSAGGTRINRDAGGNFLSETGWSGSGGGPSTFEARPAFQDGIQAIVGTHRGVPDFSFDADPNTGVSVYDSTSCQGSSGWLVFGGTSVSSPSLSGIVNSAGSNTSSAAELSLIYGSVSNGGATINSANFRDILSGTAGSFSAKTGWDFVTGIGSTLGITGK
jgi:subtilase family serine protease